MLPTLSIIFYDRNGISIPPARNLEMGLPNAINIYWDKEAVNGITYLVNEYPSIRDYLEFVRVPQKRWIKVHLKAG